MRVNRTATISAGNPINVAKLLLGWIPTYPVWAKRVLYQMRHTGSGIGYVMDGVPRSNQAPNPATDGILTAELSAASATGPGGSYADTADYVDRSWIDISLAWLDGSQTGDPVGVSADLVD